MTLYDLLESFGIEHAIDYSKLTTEQEELLDKDVEVHYQPSWPLKARVSNARTLDGKPTLALSDGGEYGRKQAWDEPDFDDED